MKKLIKLSLAAALAAFAIGSANAQMVTLQTVQDYDGSIQQFNNNQSLTQTFRNVTGVETMTYRFVSNSISTTYATTLEAYFVEWDPSLNRAVGTPIWSPVTLQVIPASNTVGWSLYTDRNGEDYLGYDYTLTPSQNALNSSATYAMILRAVSNTGPGATTRIGLQVISDTYNGNPRDSFAFGAAYQLGGTSGYSTLTSSSSSAISNNSDFGFQQLVITPVPEPSTAAACFAALFVTGLVGRRLYVKRQQAAAALVPVTVS
ncbi:hypothetical protein [Oleiharenicola lentus]|uniref:hypothetical protein n=1 Tax=Oleiharenicola lentus TaxID=2508720 RepID=UPI003F66E613